MKNKFVVGILCVLLLAACINYQSPAQSNFLLIATQTEPLNLTNTLQTSSPQLKLTEEDILATPTLRSVTNDMFCDNVTENTGYILFLKKEKTNNATGNYNLYIMDGNGCFPSLVMEGVDSSPGWSRDGNKIAIVCDENKFICILDAKSILDSCFGPKKSELTTCNPAILEKYQLPPWGESVYFISWSPDDSKIAVDGYNSVEETEDKYFLSILDLVETGKWHILQKRAYAFESDWSPVENKLAYTSEIIEMDTGDVIYDFIGNNPQWLPNGDQIAFYKEIVNDENRYTVEPAGIRKANIESGIWDWIYEPALWNSYDHPTGIILLRSFNNYRQMSWNPSGRYVVFVSHYRNSYDEQIFRLDTLTGEIKVLTVGFVPTNDVGISIAPAWGP